MEPVRTVTGRAAAIRRANIDTDQIIPAIWMKRVERSGYEAGLFRSWRRDPEFILNQPERAKTRILVAGPNFGCGSSRQHAVWALRDWGIRAVISTQIADIVTALMDATDADAATEIKIDVVARTLTCAAAGVEDEPFRLDDAPHFNLVNGFDPIDLTQRLDKVIAAHEDARDPWMPVGAVGLGRG